MYIDKYFRIYDSVDTSEQDFVFGYEVEPNEIFELMKRTIVDVNNWTSCVNYLKEITTSNKKRMTTLISNIKMIRPVADDYVKSLNRYWKTAHNMYELQICSNGILLLNTEIKSHTPFYVDSINLQNAVKAQTWQTALVDYSVKDINYTIEMYADKSIKECGKRKLGDDDQTESNKQIKINLF